MSKTINGTAVPDNRKYPAVLERIKALGKLNSDYQDAISANNRKKLISVSRQYYQMGCIRKANDILIQIGARWRWSRK
jgi:hypothetical protein